MADKDAASPSPDPAAESAYRIDVESLRTGTPAEPSDGRAHPKGRFYRPELHSPAERLSSSIGVKIAIIGGLVAVTGGLLAFAVATGAIL